MRFTALSVLCVTLMLIADGFHPVQLQAQSQEQKKYWVYFTDKGTTVPAGGVLSKHSDAYSQALALISPKALQRRAKVLPIESVISMSDVPVYEPYVHQVELTGGIIKQRSKWFNAASVVLNQAQVTVVSSFPFVKSVAPVVILHGKDLPQDQNTTTSSFAKSTSIDYGLSYTQMNLVDAIKLHQVGISGKNVRVGILDSGFRWRVHESLMGRNVLGEYDFIYHDSVTSNETGDAWNQDAHGTYTMSVLGGYKEGEIIGPAYNAEFLLAKTEYIPSETQVEEDYWTAGIEWLEANGADVVSSSVGYDIFESDTGYTWEHGDFDGRTSITARAAIQAARLGVLVCNSMGNEGVGDGIEGTMLTPADADSILSVGAVKNNRQLPTFTSTGPTNDGRIKPDVVAPGVSVYCATPGTDTYSFLQGTSLATPLVAGCASLVFSARPELTAMEVRDAIRNSADTANNTPYHEFPNNFIGWGLVDGFRAALSFGPIFSNEPTVIASGTNIIITTNVISKFGIKQDSVILYYREANTVSYTHEVMQLDSSMFFPTSGRYTGIVPMVPNGATIQFYIEAKDNGGHSYQSPAPILNKQWEYCCGTWTGIPEETTLLQNYPNPFNPATTITFEIKTGTQAEAVVFSLRGEKVKTLYNAFTEPQVVQLRWDGTNESGTPVATGVYFVRLTTPSYSSTKTMLLLR